MKKLLLILLLLPITSFSQISEVDESDLGTQIGVHMFVFQGSIEGGVTLNKLKIENNVEYHSLIWANDRYDEPGERTELKFKSTTEDINSLFEIFKNVIKTDKQKVLKLENKTVTIKPSSFKDEVIFMYELNGENKYFFIKAKGLYELFGKPWNKKEWREYLKS